MSKIFSMEQVLKTDKKEVNINDIYEAAERIKKYVRHTPLLNASAMRDEVGCDLYLKAESLQVTGAFKVRGAFNKVLSIPEEERGHGIITSSSRNHAQACAYVGRKLGIPVVTLIPKDAPAVKIRNSKEMGAEVILWERDS